MRVGTRGSTSRHGVHPMFPTMSSTRPLPRVLPSPRSPSSCPSASLRTSAPKSVLPGESERMAGQPWVLQFPMGLCPGRRASISLKLTEAASARAPRTAPDTQQVVPTASPSFAQHPLPNQPPWPHPLIESSWTPVMSWAYARLGPDCSEARAICPVVNTCPPSWTLGTQ